MQVLFIFTLIRYFSRQKIPATKSILLAEDRMFRIEFQETLPLYSPRDLESFINCCARFSQTISLELFTIHTLNFDMDINTI
jgi:hypothetical protein